MQELEPIYTSTGPQASVSIDKTQFLPIELVHEKLLGLLKATEHSKTVSVRAVDVLDMLSSMHEHLPANASFRLVLLRRKHFLWLGALHVPLIALS